MGHRDSKRNRAQGRLGGGPCTPQSLESLHSFSLERENSGSGMQAGHSFVRDNPKCPADLFTKLPPELPTHIASNVTMGPMCLKPRLIPPYK